MPSFIKSKEECFSLKSNIFSRRENSHCPVSAFSNYSGDRAKAKQGMGEQTEGSEERRKEKDKLKHSVS